MVSCKELYYKAKETLSSDFEARQLCIFVFGGLDKEADETEEKLFSELIEKRKSGYPLQYLIGEWDFYGYTFKVGEGVLIPRPDTETIVEAVLEKAKKTSVIADLCSGSGCIAIALERECGARIYAVEKSAEALTYLSENKALNDSSIEIVAGDVFAVETYDKIPPCDIIVSNPPYLTVRDMAALQTEVKYEPETALFGGDDGLDFYRKISTLWKEKIRSGGYLVFEIGMGQEKDVSEILTENGFVDIEYRMDLCKIIRAVIARKK